MRLGLTGGIACGKSVADEFFRQQQIPVLDADILVHELQGPGGLLTKAIEKAFGPEYLTQDKAVNRKKLAGLVYSDKQALQLLNDVTQPLIRKAISEEVARTTAPLAVFDIPLLFEQNYEGLFDKTLVIAAPKDQQLKRLMQRDGLNESQALRRIASQMPLAAKISRADYVIMNDGSRELFLQRLANFLQELEGLR